MTEALPRPRRWLQPLLVLLPPLLVYISSLDNGFVFDDRGSVQSRDPIHGAEVLPEHRDSVERLRRG